MKSANEKAKKKNCQSKAPSFEPGEILRVALPFEDAETPPGWSAPIRMRFHFRQQSRGANDARSGQESGGKDGIRQAELREIAGDAGADQEPDAKRNADHAEGFGALLRLGHIGDVGLREARIASRQSVDDARYENQPRENPKTRGSETRSDVPI